jgi:hypothetical protein
VETIWKHGCAAAGRCVEQFVADAAVERLDEHAVGELIAATMDIARQDASTRVHRGHWPWINE